MPSVTSQKAPSKAFLILFVFLTILTVSLLSLVNNQQVGKLEGMSEEYFTLGLNKQALGEWYPQINAPFVYRPLGYPLFIAGVLRMWGGLSDKEEVFLSEQDLNKRMHAGKTVVYGVQCLLLGCAGIFLFLWLSRFLSEKWAALGAVLFGCNPYLIIFTGALHYETVHLLFIICGGYLFSYSLQQEKEPFVWLSLSGIILGLATLVRPMTLILPVFLFVVLMGKHALDFRKILKPFLIFSIFMGLTIMPHTIRNYSLTKKIIPVNAQAGVALWAATVKHDPPSSNHYNWWKIWYVKGMPIYKRVTGLGSYDFKDYIEHNIELETEFKREAWKNFKSRPHVFFINAAHNLRTYFFDMNSVMIKYFQGLQEPARSFKFKEWIEPGNPQTFNASKAYKWFELLMGLLTILSAAGIVFAVRSKAKVMIGPGILFFLFAFAHAITYMDLMYYYVKVPFLFIFSAYALQKMSQGDPVRPWPKGGRMLAASCLAVIIIMSLILVKSVLFMA